MAERNSRKVKIGKVVSNKMDRSKGYGNQTDF